MEKGDAPVHIVNNGVGNLVVGVADDIGHLGVVHAVEHLVHDEGGDIQGHHAVEGAVDVAEGDGHRHNDQQIHRQKQPPHGQPGQLQLEQAGNEIGAAGGGALEKHHAQGAAHDHAAEDAPQNGLHRLKGVDHVENVDENGGDEHGVKGGHQQVPAQQLPPQQEQGDVQDDDHGADGSPGEDVVDDLAHAGDAAEADLVGLVAPVEAHGVHRRRQGDPQIGKDILLCDTIHSRYLLYFIPVTSSAPRPGPPAGAACPRWAGSGPGSGRR